MPSTPLVVQSHGGEGVLISRIPIAVVLLLATHHATPQAFIAILLQFVIMTFLFPALVWFVTLATVRQDKKKPPPPPPYPSPLPCALVSRSNCQIVKWYRTTIRDIV